MNVEAIRLIVLIMILISFLCGSLAFSNLYSIYKEKRNDRKSKQKTIS